MVYKAPESSLGKETSSIYQKMRKCLRNLAAGAVISLAACAGMPSQQEYASQAKGAYDSYVQLRDTGMKDAYSVSALDSIIDAHKLYTLAEDADKSSKQFTTELTKTSAMGSSMAAKTLSIVDDRDTFLKYEKLARDEGFLSNLTPEDQARYDRAKAKYAEPAKPVPVPAAPASNPFTKPAAPAAQPAVQPAQPAAQPAVQPAPAAQPAAPSVQKSPFVEDRAALSMDIGSMRSSQDRAAAIDMRAYGLSVIAHGHSDKYREETSLDKTREKGFGGYAKADLDEIAGIPAQVGASFYQTNRTRGSQESQLQEDPSFRITTVTDTDQKDTGNYFSLFGKVRLSDTTLGAKVFNGSDQTDVDVTTDLNIINKLDPAGNYHRNWTDSQKFVANTTGAQVSLDQKLAKGIDAGAYLTLDLMELKEMQRNINTYTLDVFLKAMTEDSKYGASVLIGQGLLDDAGEQNDMFTKPRYSLVAGAELTDWLTIGAQFNRMENPDGSFIFLLGAKGALPYMISNRWEQNMSVLGNLREMSPELQKVYLRGLFNDFTWAVAQQNVWALSGDVGARRVMTLDKGDKTVFEGSATAYIPVHSTFTGTVTPFIAYDGLEGLLQRYGVIVGGHAVGQRWHFFVEASREKADGRAQEDEDFRAVGGIAFPFGK